MKTKDRILLGYIDGDAYYLRKHSWDCEWYWGMGYIGNDSLHTHFDSMFLNENFIGSYNPFSECNLSSKNWNVLLDLFKQAYILKGAAAVYRRGGYISTLIGVTDKIKDIKMENRINKDLEIILNTIWTFLLEKIENNVKNYHE